MTATTTHSPKQQARELVERLPETASWEDVVYQMALHRSIQKGLAQADAGMLIPAEDLLEAYAPESE